MTAVILGSIVGVVIAFRARRRKRKERTEAVMFTWPFEPGTFRERQKPKEWR